MVVEDLAASRGTETTWRAGSCATAHTSLTSSGAELQAVGLLVDLAGRGRRPCRARCRPRSASWAVAVDLLGVDSRKLFGAEEVLARSRGSLPKTSSSPSKRTRSTPQGVFRVVQMVGDLHQERNARGPVVGAQERQLVAVRATFLVGVRPRVVVGRRSRPARADPGYHEPIRLTIAAAAGHGMQGPERLLATLSAHLFEMVGDHLALAGVGFSEPAVRGPISQICFRYP